MAAEITYYLWGRITDTLPGATAGWSECLQVNQRSPTLVPATTTSQPKDDDDDAEAASEENVDKDDEEEANSGVEDDHLGSPILENTEELQLACEAIFQDLHADRSAYAVAQRSFATPVGAQRWFYFAGGVSAYRNALGVAWSENPAETDPANLPVRFIFAANTHAAADAPSSLANNNSDFESDNVLSGHTVLLPISTTAFPESVVLGEDSRGTPIIDCTYRTLCRNTEPWPVFAYFFLLQNAWSQVSDGGPATGEWFLDTTAPVYWANAVLNAATDKASHAAIVPFETPIDVGNGSVATEAIGFEDLDRLRWAPHVISRDFSDIVGATGVFLRAENGVDETRFAYLPAEMQVFLDDEDEPIEYIDDDDDHDADDIGHYAEVHENGQYIGNSNGKIDSVPGVDGTATFAYLNEFDR